MSESLSRTISILGCGWLGEPLALHLHTNGFMVKVSTRSNNPPPSIKRLGIPHFQIDLEQEITDPHFFDSDELVIAIPSKNIEGFQKLLDYLAKIKTKRILFISSTSVYQPNKLPINENGIRNSNPLAQIEDLFVQSSLNTIILRFAGLIGYNRRPVNFISKVRKMSNPQGVVNLVHRDDCIAILTKLLGTNVEEGIFNVCASSHPNRKEFYTRLAQLHGRSSPVFQEDTESVMKYIDNSKIKETLNYTFIHDDLTLLHREDYEY